MIRTRSLGSSAYSIEQWASRVFQLHIGSSADVNAQDGDWTALYQAAEEGAMMVQFRVRMDQNINQNTLGAAVELNATHRMWKRGHFKLEVLQLLLKYSINTNPIYGWRNSAVPGIEHFEES